MDSHFTAYLYRLRHIERWSLMRNTTRENVAEHSYHVALLAHMLCEIGNRVFGRRLNADRASAMALFHDATEVFTGDIPTPVKHHNPKMLANFRELEAMAGERLLGMVPPELQDAYAPLVIGGSGHATQAAAAKPSDADEAVDAAGSALDGCTPASSRPESGDADRELEKMVKAADLLDAYIKCLSELSSGNREFAVAKGQTEHALAKLNMPEVEWFLSTMAPSFSKTLDELSSGDQPIG